MQRRTLLPMLLLTPAALLALRAEAHPRVSQEGSTKRSISVAPDADAYAQGAAVSTDHGSRPLHAPATLRFLQPVPGASL